jgi:hypothetical protein
MNTSQYKVGDKVVIDDEQGTIESINATHPSGAVRYTVQYGRSILSAVDVAESELEPWVEGI